MKLLRTNAKLACLLAALLFFSIAMINCNDDKGSSSDTDGDIDISGALLVPTGWEGVWDLNVSFSDCSTEKLYAEYIFEDTMKVGDSISIMVPMLSVCTGTIRGDSLFFNSSYGWMDGACSVTVSLEVASELNAGAISGSGEWTVELSGDCELYQHQEGSEAIELTGTITDRQSRDSV